MRLIFAGTPVFAERALARLLDAGHAVPLVLTQPDRPAGRGMRSAASPVKLLAERHGIDVFQPATLRAPEALDRLRTHSADALVVAAYGLILPPAVLEVARFGAINIHASLLPRWRGAAPIQRALLAGDSQTGVSIMRMDAGLDTGPVFVQRPITIAADDDGGTLHDKLADLGADTLVEVLAAIEQGRTHAVPQAEGAATYARKVEKPDTVLRWDRAAVELERLVRAFRPAPGALTHLGGESIKVWRGRVAPGSGDPGRVLSQRDALQVACGTDSLIIEELQPAGGRRMSSAEFLRGRRLPEGVRFE
ncbi:MAG TPA: methionyl-tRNA formyltransferase [Burkholderiales bacterium]|nr:methionyl-tRNA formyltransferase [Burkholderiales bacterium]